MIATKKFLYLYHIENNPHCRFCEEEEDLRHLFYFCPFVYKFWLSVQVWLKMARIELTITPQTIVLGHFTGSFLLLNTILLIGKMFIFKTKHHQACF